MSFQTGLSGLNASSRSLDVIGNNIANANTTGMKSSRTEFGDLVASSLGAGGSGGAGIGVAVAAVAQQFTQGNISTTGNSLDVAINGGGFFQLTQPDGSAAYTRDGSFKLDKDGFIKTNSGASVMGYPTDKTGQPTSVTLQKLQLPTSAPIAASATTAIVAEFNLDARAPIASTVVGVTASYTTAPLPGLDFSVLPKIDTTTVASGIYTKPTSTTATDAFQFNIDSKVPPIFDGLVADATAANLDTKIAAFVKASGGAYTQTGTVAAGNLVITKADGTDVVISTTFSNAIGSTNAPAGTTGGGNFANAAFIGTTTNTNPVGRTFSAVGPGGTPMTITLDKAYADINAVLTAIQTSPGYSTSGMTAAVDAAGTGLTFTATSTNTAGQIVFGGGSNANFLTTGGTSSPGVAKTAAVPTPRATYGTSLNAYDSQGVAMPVNLYFTKVTPTTAGTDEWAVYDTPTGATVGSLVFDASGKLQSSTVGNLTLTPAFPSIVPPFTVTVDISKVTQYGAAFAVSNLTQDGYAPGELTGLSIGESGVITTRYSNGQTQSSGQLSLADFRNVQGLAPIGQNAWASTFASGEPVKGSPGNGRFGALRSGALEESNVDLTSELVNMMTAQRSYQANAQTIKTQDQIMSTLVNMR
jgi:flagellar hook protein FlgE